MEDAEEDPILNSLQHRRIPHGRSRRNGRSSGKGRSQQGGNKLFDPLRALGMYEVKHGILSQSLSNGTGSVLEQTLSSTASYLVIHELTTHENGLVATFRIGETNGMGILSGSRKVLQSIIDEYDHYKSERKNEDVDEEERRESEGGADLSTNEDENVRQQDRQKSTLEEEDDRINRRARAFEKNSFRNPKFWMRWKIHGDGDLLEQPVTPQKKNENGTEEGNEMAYLIFSGNDCLKFEGTITSQRLGWHNIKLKGHKVKSRVAMCPIRWNECST